MSGWRRRDRARARPRSRPPRRRPRSSRRSRASPRGRGAPSRGRRSGQPGSSSPSSALPVRRLDLAPRRAPSIDRRVAGRRGRRAGAAAEPAPGARAAPRSGPRSRRPTRLRMDGLPRSQLAWRRMPSRPRPSPPRRSGERRRIEPDAVVANHDHGSPALSPSSTRIVAGIRVPARRCSPPRPSSRRAPARPSPPAAAGSPTTWLTTWVPAVSRASQLSSASPSPSSSRPGGSRLVRTARTSRIAVGARRPRSARCASTRSAAVRSGDDARGLEEPVGADHRLGGGVVDLVGDPRPLVVLAAKRLRGRADRAARRCRSSSARCRCDDAVELVELLARGDHLGERRRRDAPPVGRPGPLPDLPRVRASPGPGACVPRRARPRRPGARPCARPVEARAAGPGPGWPTASASRGVGRPIRRTAARSRAPRGAGNARSRTPAGHRPAAARPSRIARAAVLVGQRPQKARPTSVVQTGHAERCGVLPARDQLGLGGVRREHPELGRPQEAGDGRIVHAAECSVGRGASEPG